MLDIMNTKSMQRLFRAVYLVLLKIYVPRLLLPSEVIILCLLERGRYDLRRTPAENINLPPALLSRFDLLWLILDRADMQSDTDMAKHVLYVHQNFESPDLGFTPLEPSILR